MKPGPPKPMSRPSPLRPEPWLQGLRAQHRASAPGPNDRELSAVQATASWPGRCALWLPWPSLLAPAPRPQVFYQSPRALFPLLGRGGEGRWTQPLRGLQRGWGTLGFPCSRPGACRSRGSVPLLSPDISRVSRLQPLTELYVPGGPPSVERGGHLPARGLGLC